MKPPLSSNSFWGRRLYYLSHRTSIRASDEHRLFSRVEWPAAPGQTPASGEIESSPVLDLPKEWASLLKETKTRSLQVYRSGKLVRQWLAGSEELHRPGRLYSVTKSVLSLAFAVALEEGLVGPLQTPLSEVFPWARGKLSTLTLQQLLHMDSGIAFDEGFRFFNLQVKTYLHPRSRDVCRNARVRDAVGEFFHYNDVHSLLLAWAIERALIRCNWSPRKQLEGPKSLVAAWIYERILEPIGVRDAGGFVVDSPVSGFAKAESGLFLSVSDAAKIGQLVLDRGRCGQKQIVPAWWIDACTKLTDGWSRPQDFELYRDTSWGNWLDSDRAFYQNHWWGIRDKEKPIASFAMGIHGQIVLISPKHDAVVVRLADRWALKDWWPERLLKLLDELEEFSPQQPSS